MEVIANYFSLVSSIILFLVSLACLFFVRKHPESNLKLLMFAAWAGFLYFSFLYLISFLGYSFYLLKTGLLTRLGVIYLGAIIFGIILIIWKNDEY
jgi:hypothetical protein